MKTTDYRAFISYSHSDERWARWLHRALESYRIPGKLVGTKTPSGAVPKHLRPIFRDRDDLSSASDLSTTVIATLAKSDNLIVICSPAAASSRWVNEEIREFVRSGKQQRILCIIVDGDPSATSVEANCFPVALAEAGLHEPLAADVRKWADGKHLAKLKLIAGMLGVPLDQLRRRDLQKRRKLRILTGVASIFVVSILVAAVWFKVSSQLRRDSGELLVAVKLNELRTLLEVNEDPEDLYLLKEWSKQDLAALTSAAGEEKSALIRSAMELREQGKKQWQKGAIQDAIETFRKSWALIAVSYRMERADQSVFFELGQAAFWIGQMHLDLGELDQAEHFFMSYAEITRRLILLQPKNDQWVLEMSYALTNLGIVQRVRGLSNPVRALQLMQSALEYNQIALVLDPTNSYYRSELGQSNANLADAQKDVCDLQGALGSQKENTALQSELYQKNNTDVRSILRLAFAISGYANIQQMMGDLSGSRSGLERSLKLVEEALAQKPGDTIRHRQVLERKQRLAWLAAMAGDIDQAWAASTAIEEEWQNLLPENGPGDIRTMQAYAQYLLDRTWIARARGEQALAERIAEENIELLKSLVLRLPGTRDLGNLLTATAFQNWETRHELPSPETLALLPDYSANSGRMRACTDADMAFRKAIMLDEWALAGDLSNYLLKSGYREAHFMQICQSYSLCSEK